MTDAESQLRELLLPIARQHHYDNEDITIKAINSGGANYTSTLFLATISTPPLPDLKLFAKVASVSINFREKVQADRLFKTEDTFYNKLDKVWNRLQDKYGLHEEERFVAPKYYGGKSERGYETVVLEDLQAAGYENYDRFKSMDWEHASKSMEALAKFHALSFVYAKEEPVEYEKMVEELKLERMSHEDDPAAQEMMKSIVGGAVAAVDERKRERVQNFFAKYNVGAMYHEYRLPNRKPLLVHGDYRPSNLLFKKQEGGVVAKVLDFQTLHAGRPVADLIYFVVLGTDEAFRKEHYDRLVDHYYQQLTIMLERFQIKIDEVYPREHFDEDLKETMPYAMCLAVAVLPVVMVEADSAPKLNSDDADLKDFVLAPTEVYTERFDGILNDMIRWDVI